MKVIELFAGAGGAALGLHRAGFEHLACVEKDKNAAATLKAAGFPAQCIDVADFEWSGPVDVLWASPPCQPYSKAGKRKGAADPRDGWEITKTQIKNLKPTWVVIENVVGSPVSQWIMELYGIGFRSVSAVVMNAADYGIPQQRDRAFIVAGPRFIHWPEATHADPDSLGRDAIFGDDRKPWVGWGAALGIDDRRLVPQNTGHLVPKKPRQPAHYITSVRMYLVPSMSKTAVPRSPEQPAHSVLSASRHYILKGSEKTALTHAQAAKLMGFPDDYPFQGNSDSIYRQIGNAVVPLIATLIGQAIKEAA